MALYIGGVYEKRGAPAHLQKPIFAHQFVDLSQGIPSGFTLERVMSLVEPKALEAMLKEMAHLLRKKMVDDVIAIDGKSLRGSATKIIDLFIYCTPGVVRIGFAWRKLRSQTRAIKLPQFMDC